MFAGINLVQRVRKISVQGQNMRGRLPGGGQETTT